MDKPSDDFVLPTTFIGVGVNNYFTDENASEWYFGFTSFKLQVKIKNLLIIWFVQN